MKIEEMYNSMNTIVTEFDNLKRDYPEILKACNYMSAMLVMCMHSEEVPAMAFKKDDILMYIDKTVSAWSYNPELDALVLQVFKRPEDTPQ